MPEINISAMSSDHWMRANCVMLKEPKWDIVNSHEVKERMMMVYTTGAIALTACACMEVMARPCKAVKA
jgi:hypothetical protein